MYKVDDFFCIEVTDGKFQKCGDISLLYFACLSACDF